MVVGPIAFLKIIGGGGGISFGKGRTRASEAETKVSEAEILEEMCLLSWIALGMRRAGDRLSDAERTLLTKKIVGGSSFFRVSNTEKGEGIKEWLSNPFSRVLIQSMSIDCPTMEGILRKVLQESFDSSYQTAKGRTIAKKQIMNRAMRELRQIPPDDWSKRSQIWSKVQEGYIDVQRGNWRKYLKGSDTGEEPDKLEE